jgi:hypothetical protein
MKHLLLSLCLLLLFPAVALAQSPTPTPFPNPYNFQPVDFESGEQNPALAGLADMLADVSFINRFGSIAVTVWAILDNFAGGGVLAYAVIIILGLVVIRFVARFVYNKPVNEPLNLTGAADTVGQFDAEAGRRSKTIVRLLKNKPRF